MRCVLAVILPVVLLASGGSACAHASYYPDVQAIRQAPRGLAKLIAEGHRLESRGEVITPDIVSLRVYPKGQVPPFNNLAQVQRATALGEAYPRSAPEVDAAYAVVDAHLIYATAGEEFTLSSTLSNQVIGQPEIQNLIVDHRAHGEVIYRSSGPLDKPVLINPSHWSAIRSFIAHGAEHVLGGVDHLLLILCLTLGSAGLASLAWRITGFTLGHTVSLILGFWGYVPSAPWFVPAVETTIALSIVGAGASLFLDCIKHRGLMGLIVIVGFVHGLGFSFGLREMLDAKGPHVWTSLAAFNVRHRGLARRLSIVAPVACGQTPVVSRHRAAMHGAERLLGCRAHAAHLGLIWV